MVMNRILLLKFIISEAIIGSFMLVLNFRQIRVNDYYSFINISDGIAFILSGVFAYFLMDKKPIPSKWKIISSSFFGTYLFIFFINMWLVPLIILKHIQDYAEIIDGVYAYKSEAFNGLVPYTYALG